MDFEIPASRFVWQEGDVVIIRRAEEQESAEALYPICIYTIRHSRDLAAALEQGGTHTWQENTQWVSGKNLLGLAHDAGQQMPILFAFADRESNLEYAAILERVDLVDSSTNYTFSHLRRLDGTHKLSSLQVRSTGRALPESSIRPYVICGTPAWAGN